MKSDVGSEQAGRARGWWWLPLSLLIIALDQWTKLVAVEHLPYGVPQAVMPSLNWTLVHNHGGAFSFLSDHDGWQRWLFLVLASAITLVLLEWLRRTPARVWALCLPLALLIGGAIGNLIDRVRLGYVIDFVQVYWREWAWPAFNIADSGITVGIILLLVYEVYGQRRHTADTDADGSHTR